MRPTSGSSDVVIIGGGVIGLSIAYVLANEGRSATVLDRGELGRQASWAGAGLIPPFLARRDDTPMTALRSWSAALYRAWSPALREETGIDNGYRRTGGVDVAATDAEEQALRTAAGRWRVEGIAAERMAPQDFRRVEPALNPDLRLAYFLPDRAQIRNPRHLQGAGSDRSLIRRGVGLMLGVCRFWGSRRLGGARSSAFETARAVSLSAGRVVIAGGACDLVGRSLPTRGSSVQAPTPPLKGQIVLLRSDAALALRPVIEHGKNYLVPRDDGRILVGATEEDAGFDLRSTRSTPSATLIDEALFLCARCLADGRGRTDLGGTPTGEPRHPPLHRPSAPGFDNLVVASGPQARRPPACPFDGRGRGRPGAGEEARIDLSPFAIDRNPARDDDAGFRS